MLIQLLKSTFIFLSFVAKAKVLNVSSYYVGIGFNVIIITIVHDY